MIIHGTPPDIDGYTSCGVLGIIGRGYFRSHPYDCVPDNGYGFGYGFGCSNGEGDGALAAEYARALLQQWVDKLPSCRAAQEAGATLALWWSDKEGRPCNGGDGDPVHTGLVQEVEPPLTPCSTNALHATLDINSWHGDRLWIVALYGKIIEQEGKMAALKREILAECPWQPRA
ncbi:MAG: hypothetical protein D6773_05940 [Alphaproteobacteria bacterium]|nr:MAG: hypothetical protein D6773_05940 [Alphaproteobacteria bacterium]